MKNLKSTIALLISGLVLFLILGLPHCNAQTNNGQEYGIKVTHCDKEYLYGEDHKLFKGSKPKAIEKKKDLEKQEDIISNNNVSDMVGDKMDIHDERVRKQARVYDTELRHALKRTYKVVKLSDNGALLMTDKEYLQIARQWVNQEKFDFNYFAKNKYSNYCQQNNLSGNNNDYQNFKNRLNEILSDNLSKLISSEKYKALAHQSLGKKDLDAFAKEQYKVLRQEHEVKDKWSDSDYRNFYKTLKEFKEKEKDLLRKKNEEQHK